MDKFQSGLLAISSATLLIFIIYTLVNEKKSSKWFKWYNQMDSEEQKKYNINFHGCICFNFYYSSCFYRIFGTKRM
ncbi:hypothetical protein [Clostridium botulinum]|uniref:hypothetical protein n=1 Tax=Clostridium botulinum TaxID=1491 RepID=UPI001FA84AD7|nr:hypothetical protein [Clostridium botulinum]